MEEHIAQFCGVTGATTREAKKFLEKYKRIDMAIDAYYNNHSEFSQSMRHQQPPSAAPSTSKITALFNRYKDPEGEEITVDGTIKLCSDLGVDPEDVVLLAVAFELKSQQMGEWKKQGWVDGWKSLGCDSIDSIQKVLPRLRQKLAEDFVYFRKVYNHTFDFARSDGQRSLGIETAQAFWGLLLPHGLEGGALSHKRENDGEDVVMDKEEGWKPHYVQWWFDFLNERGGKGISKDTWIMFLDFVQSIDSRFSKYDMEAAWPSTIDDFVEYAKQRLESEV